MTPPGSGTPKLVLEECVSPKPFALTSSVGHFAFVPRPVLCLPPLGVSRMNTERPPSTTDVPQPQLLHGDLISRTPR